MPGGVHHFDPSRLQATSKFIDHEYASKTVVVPATRERRKPLPGRLWHDEACRHHPVRRKFAAHEIQFEATLARRVDNALLVKEMFLFDESRMYLDTSIEMEYAREHGVPEVTQRFSEALRASADAPVDDRFRDDTLLVSHHEGGGTWGHYLAQSIPRMLLFLDAFPSGKIAVPTHYADGAPGFGEALAFYDIPGERLAPVDPGTVYPIKQAILLDFLFNFQVGAPHPKVLPLLRNFPTEHAAPTGNTAAFIKRRADANRAIGNEQAVDAVMARHKVDVYGPDELPLRTQIELWRSHDLLIATLGSDLTNIVYARPGTRVLVLSPHWFGDVFFFELSVAAGVRWHELRCGETAGSPEQRDRHSSFNVDVELLDSILVSLLS